MTTGKSSPGNIILLQSFPATEDVPYYIQISNVLILMPFFRWCADTTMWVDATGDYDLCMMPDGMQYIFISRRTGTSTFAYRYMSSFFPASYYQELTYPR